MISLALLTRSRTTAHEIDRAGSSWSNPLVRRGNPSFSGGGPTSAFQKYHSSNAPRTSPSIGATAGGEPGTSGAQAGLARASNPIIVGAGSSAFRPVQALASSGGAPSAQPPRSNSDHTQPAPGATNTGPSGSAAPTYRSSRSESAAARSAARTPSERSAIASKGWETRRKKAPAVTVRRPRDPPSRQARVEAGHRAWQTRLERGTANARRPPGSRMRGPDQSADAFANRSRAQRELAEARRLERLQKALAHATNYLPASTSSHMPDSAALSHMPPGPTGLSRRDTHVEVGFEDSRITSRGLPGTGDGRSAFHPYQRPTAARVGVSASESGNDGHSQAGHTAPHVVSAPGLDPSGAQTFMHSATVAPAASLASSSQPLHHSHQGQPSYNSQDQPHPPLPLGHQQAGRPQPYASYGTDRRAEAGRLGWQTRRERIRLGGQPSRPPRPPRSSPTQRPRRAPKAVDPERALEIHHARVQGSIRGWEKRRAQAPDGKVTTGLRGPDRNPAEARARRSRAQQPYADAAKRARAAALKAELEALRHRPGSSQDPSGSGAGPSSSGLSRRDESSAIILARGLPGMGGPGSAFNKYNKASAPEPGSTSASTGSGTQLSTMASTTPLVGSGTSAFRPVTAFAADAESRAPTAHDPIGTSQPPRDEAQVRPEHLYGAYKGWAKRRARADGGKVKMSTTEEARLARSVSANKGWDTRRSKAGGGPVKMSTDEASFDARKAAARKGWETRRGKAPDGVVTMRRVPDRNPEQAHINRSLARKKYADAQRQARRAAHIAKMTKNKPKSGGASAGLGELSRRSQFTKVSQRRIFARGVDMGGPGSAFHSYESHPPRHEKESVLPAPRRQLTPTVGSGGSAFHAVTAPPVVDHPSPHLSLSFPTPTQQSAPEIVPPTLTRKFTQTGSFLERIRASGTSTPAEVQGKAEKWMANLSNAQREVWVRRRKEGRDAIPRNPILKVDNSSGQTTASSSSGPKRNSPKLPSTQTLQSIATRREEEAAAEQKARDAKKRKRKSAASLKAWERRRLAALPAEMGKPPPLPPSPSSEEARAQKRRETAAKRSATWREERKHKPAPLSKQEELAQANEQARRGAQLALARRKQKQAASSSASGAPKHTPA